MKYFLTMLVLILATSLISIAQNRYTYYQPVTMEDGWETNNLKSITSDTARLYAFFNQIIKEEHKIHSVLLAKNGQLIIEEYFNGYDVTKPHDIRSVTKSIKVLLLGIALDNGYIEDIDDPIAKYLKSHSPNKNIDERKDKITIRHLITMSAGWDCNDWDKKSKGQEDKVYKKKDWIQYTLDLPMIHEPGEVSSYCSMGVTIMTEMISQASGLSIDQFAAKYLFQPLGIKNYTWEHTSEKEVIQSSKRLHLTPRDLAKIGQLVLNKGNWKGKQIISSKWIEEMTTTHTSITGIDYGYLWWNIPFKIEERTFVSKTATGNGGQYIMVLPELEIVAVFTGGAYNSQEDKLPFTLLNNVLLPTFYHENIKPNR